MKLKDLCLKITDGTHSTVIDSPNGDYFLLSCKNIKNGSVVYSIDDRRIDNQTLALLRQRTKMSIDDIVVSSVGTIGEVAHICDHPNYEFQRSVAILKPNKNLINPKYLKYFLSSNIGQNEIKGRIKGAAQPCLFLSDIKDIDIQLPEMKCQQHIVDSMRRFLYATI